MATKQARPQPQSGEELAIPDAWPFQVVWHAKNADMLDRVLELQEAQQIPKASLIMADPPWTYSDGARGESHRTQKGLASGQYDGASVGQIYEALKRAHQACTLDAYLQMWCTFPQLEEWMQWSLELLNCWPKNHPNEQRGWRYVTGGAWGKTNGLGIGHHYRGDAEVMLLYVKGNPKPRTVASNLWLAARVGHSEKPQLALRRQIDMATKEGDLVIDLYAGQSGSAARACRALGRSYIGAELDYKRWKQAQQFMGVQDLPMEVYPLESRIDPELQLLLPVSESESKWATLSPEQAKNLRRDGHL